MGAVGADRKLQLNESLVGRYAACIAPPPQLPAYLGELARPERQGQGLADVAKPLVGRAVGELIARAGEHPPSELVIGARVEPPARLRPSGLLPAAAAARPG